MRGYTKEGIYYHAEGAQIDLGSFIKSLDITIASACISLMPIDIQISPLAIDPQPLPAADESVVRLLCTLIENSAVSGTITFRLDTALQDNLSNHLVEDFALLINN